MKKIAFFTVDMKIGGMEKALVFLLNQLINDYDITLFLQNANGLLINDLNKNIKIKELYSSKSKIILKRKFANFIYRVIWNLKYKNKFHFSCNYATYFVLGSKLALNASKNNAIYIHSDYYSLYDGNIEKIKSFFNTIYIKKFSSIIFVSNESMEKVKPLYGEIQTKFHVVSNIVDYESIENSVFEYEHLKYNSDETINFIFVGRLVEESKNISYLIDLFFEISKKNNNFRLLIVGDGPNKKQYIEKVNNMKLNDKITFFDETPNPYKLLKSADFLILTSKYEGFPVVYNEALILKLKIITTVPVSDDFLDIKEHSIMINYNLEESTDIILKNIKNKEVSNIDFEILNKKRINKLKKIINLEKRK